MAASDNGRSRRIQRLREHEFKSARGLVNYLETEALEGSEEVEGVRELIESARHLRDRIGQRLDDVKA